MRVDPVSPANLHGARRERLEAPQLEGMVAHPHDYQRIPSESKLAGEIYVSRTTIRRALKDLEEEGKSSTPQAE